MWGVNGTRRSRSIGFAQSLIEDHAADDLAKPWAAVFLSHQQAFGTTPTACIRFAVLSPIEILHILLEHFYDSKRNENARLSSPTSSAAASREKPGWSGLSEITDTEEVTVQTQNRPPASPLAQGHSAP